MCRTPLYCRYLKSEIVDLSNRFNISDILPFDAAIFSGLSLSISKIRHLSESCSSINARNRPKAGANSGLLTFRNPPPIIHTIIEAESVKICRRSKSRAVKTLRNGL